MLRLVTLWALVVFASPALASADLKLPVDHGVVTSGVGWRLDPFGSGKRVFHRGIDIAVPLGTPVHATRKGRVVLAGDDHHGHGFTVIVEHENGDRTLYGHNSSLLVHKGETVDAGTVLALSGTSGRSTGPHVHYELQPSGRPIPIEADRIDVAAVDSPKRIMSDPERQQLEQKLDDSVNAILKSLVKSRITGEGG